MLNVFYTDKKTLGKVEFDLNGKWPHKKVYISDTSNPDFREVIQKKNDRIYFTTLKISVPLEDLKKIMESEDGGFPDILKSSVFNLP